MISNPEVKALVPTLLGGIAHPDTKGRDAMEKLLSTTFTNTVDAVSLALIVPILHRGLRDRSGDLKKRASRIVGSMCQLINEPKVITPVITHELGNRSAICLWHAAVFGSDSCLSPECKLLSQHTCSTWTNIRKEILTHSIQHVIGCHTCL